ncbi:MAG: hypothetical protein EOO13_18070 [Chitinophagaceae bacterium]|nr:MAG: hypothetical protein EOO13_18070 [Chitinophagaceae bacterium]
MASFRLYFTLLFLLISFSSCFQILEEITLRNNGTGEMLLTFNLSQSKSKLASIMLLDSVNGYKVPSEKDIQDYMNETVDFLKGSNGISNIKKSVDLKNYIFSVGFSFKEVGNINGITQRLLSKQKTKGPAISYSFDKVNGNFKKTYTHSAQMKKDYDQLKSKDKEIFKTAGFVSISRFEKTVGSSSNKLSKISPSGKAVMTKASALELINGTANISNQIQLNK